MGTADDDGEPREEKLAQAVARYVDLVATGGAPHPRTFAAEHPDLAPELEEELKAFHGVTSLIDEGTPSIVFRDYRIVAEIARGGMGIVYDAWQISLDRRVALKVLPGWFLADPKAVARFRREARVAGSLRHEGIVQIYDMGVESGVPYYAMEYVRGETLQQIQERWQEEDGRDDGSSTQGIAVLEEKMASTPRLIRLSDEGETARHNGLQPLADGKAVDTPSLLKEGGLAPTLPYRAKDTTQDLLPKKPTPAAPGRHVSPTESHPARQEASRPLFYRQLALMFAGAAEALHFAHTEGILHRDIKPSNLILDAGGKLRILDFGLAWIEGQENLTLSQEFMGTPAYMSPEQAQGMRDALGPGTDIYSLGVTIYEFLAGRSPFSATTFREVLEQIIHNDAPPIRRFSRGVPRELETIALKCLRKRPQDRYLSGEALAQDLRRFAANEPIEAQPESLCERLLRSTWRRKGRVLQGAGLLVLLFSLGALLELHRIEVVKEELSKYELLYRNAGTRIFAGRSPRHAPQGRAVLVRGPETETFPGLSSGDSVRVVPAFAEAGASVLEVGTDATQEAMDELRRAIQLRPQSPEAYLYMARALLSLGRAEEAKEYLHKSIQRKIDPDLAVAAHRLMKRMGLIEAQEKLPVEGVRSDWIKTWIEANLAALEDRWEDADFFFGRLIAEDEDDAGQPRNMALAMENHLLRGIARLEAGKPEEALVDLGISCAFWESLGRQGMEPPLLLARAYYRGANAEAAAQTLKKLAGMGARATLEVAAMHADLGDFETALKDLRAVSDSAQSLELKARILCHLDRWVEARAMAMEARRLDPSDVSLYLLSGYILKALGESEAALKEYEAALLVGSNDPRIHVAIAVEMEARGRADLAKQQLELAIRAAPRCGNAHFHLARILRLEGHTEKAEAEYLEAIRLAPRDSATHNDLGILLGQEDRLAEAIQVFEKALAAHPGFAQAHYNLAWASHRMNRLDEAIDEYRKALAAGLEDAVVHNNLGAALHQKGKYFEAVEEYQKSIQQEPSLAEAHQNLAGAVLGEFGVTPDSPESQKAGGPDPSGTDAPRTRD